MYYAVYDKETGELISTGTELNPNLDKKFDVVEMGDDFDTEQEAVSDWDVTNLTFVPKPIPVIKTKEERIAEINADLKLTPEQLQALEKYI